MIRIMLISAAAAAGLALPAIADEASSIDAGKSAAFSAELANAANAQQARVQLAHQGYTGISALSRDESGRWIGTAIKDGQTVVVAVVTPHAQSSTTN